MKTDKSLNDIFSELEKSPRFRLEKLILDVLEKISIAMDEEGMNQAELARRLKTSRAFVTKLLNGYPNMTISTLFNISEALDRKIHFSLPSKNFETRTVSWVEGMRKANYRNIQDKFKDFSMEIPTSTGEKEDAQPLAA